jgi:hypothetical protein
MASRHRRRLIWIYGSLFALPAWVGCSLQNFDYLTANPDAGPDVTTGMPETGTSDDAHQDVISSSMDAARDGTTGVDAGPDADASVKDVVVSDGFDGYSGPPNLVQNPDFDSAYSHWTFVPPSAQGVTAFVQAPIGSATTPQNQAYELATYSNTAAFTVDMSQTITSLPDGQYTFAAWFSCGANNQMYIYTKGCDSTAEAGPDAGITKLDIPQTTPTTWEQVVMSPVTVTGGKCTVGLFVDAAQADWLNADRFTFTLIPPDDAGADAATD